MPRGRTARLLSSLLCLALSASLSMSLEGCAPSDFAVKQKVSTVLDVPVTQPDLKHLLAVTSKMQIVASGQFAPGNYWSHKKQLSFAPDTSFQVNLEMPVENPDILSTRNATGFLATSKEFAVNAVPVPKNIQLVEGKLTGEVEYGKWLGAFLVNLLQLGNNDGGLRSTIASMKIESARLELKPGAKLVFGQKSLIVGENSSITLNNLDIDHDLNYRGEMVFDLNFDKGCDWLGKRVDTRFNGGFARLYLIVEGRDKTLTLSLNKEHPTVLDSHTVDIRLEDCRFNFGHEKLSSSISESAAIDVTDLKWSRFSAVEEPTLELKSTMTLVATAADINTSSHQTKLTLPNAVNTVLDINTKGKESDTHFATMGDAVARTIAITLNKSHTSLTLLLEDGTLGPVSFDKFGKLNFSLKRGDARFKSLDWRSDNSRFTLDGAGESTLTVPTEMFLEQTRGGKQTTLSLPIDIHVGEAKVKLGDEETILEQLKGKLRFDVAKEIQMESDLDFTIKHSPLLKDEEAEVKVRGLDLEIGDTTSRLSLKQCRVLVPNQALSMAIQAETPSSFEIELNKTVVEDKHWRYKNAIAKNVFVNNLKITNMRPKQHGSLDFQASADVVLEGTVDKCGLLIGKDKWETKPWSLKAHLKGPGSVKYNFAARKERLSEVNYDLAMRLPLPKDMDLDWSEVGAGILQATERQVILSHLRKITIPVKHKGTLELFQNKKYKDLSIVKLVVKPYEAGSQVEFSANVKL